MISLKSTTLFLLCTFISYFGYGQLITVSTFSNKDAYVVKPAISIYPNDPANQNYGNSPELKVSKTVAMFSSANRSYISFDLAGLIAANQIPTNAVITNATIRFRIASESGVTNTNLLLRKVGSSWTETGITFNNQPTLLSDNQITSSVKSTMYEFMNPEQVSDRTFNVTNHLQEFIKNPAAFYGWCLSALDETVTPDLAAVYHSRKYTGCFNSGGLSCIPRLTVEYYLPYKLTGATVANASSSSANDGNIFPVIANGSGNNTYKWYKNGGTTVIGTSQNLTGQGPGWYGLEVTGSKGDKFYMAFIIGNECGATAIEFKPGPNYIDEALISKIQSNHIYGPQNESVSATYSSNGVITTETVSLMRFRLWISGSLEINKADLFLSGKGHTGTNNNVNLFRNTADFVETATASSAAYPGPATTTTGQISIGVKTGSENTVVDMKNLWNTWKANNLTNFGLTVRMASASGTVTKGQVYHSSNSTNFNVTPEISFVLVGTSAFNCVCSPTYATLSRELKGVNYPVCVDKFYFRYEEEYTGASLLNYKVYNANNQSAISGIPPLLSKEYGENRYALPVGTLASGTYILEVQNDKKEKFYLRFTK